MEVYGFRKTLKARGIFFYFVAALLTND